VRLWGVEAGGRKLKGPCADGFDGFLSELRSAIIQRDVRGTAGGVEGYVEDDIAPEQAIFGERCGDD
jgi:hypothetical protein